MAKGGWVYIMANRYRGGMYVGVTADAIRRESERHPEEVHPVFVKVNAGKGNALRRGFAASRGSHILLFDGDLDLSPANISVFFSIMERDAASIVIGSIVNPPAACKCVRRTSRLSRSRMSVPPPPSKLSAIRPE